MRGELRIPGAGMALLMLTVIGLVAAGFSLVGVAVIAVVWLLTLWLDWLLPPGQPQPIEIVAKPDLDAITRAALEAVVEPVSVPLMITDATRIFAANASARAAFGAHVTGQDARVALRHPLAIGLLDLADGGTTTVPGLTGAGSLWQITLSAIPVSTIPGGFWLIELRDRSNEADMSRAHTDFVANASHELRTPLSSVIGYVETLAEAPESFDPPTAKRFLGTVLREARRMDSLVSDLMSLSHLEAEKHDVPTDHVDLGALAARVVGEFALDGRIRLARPEVPVVVVGDTSQLEQLVRNLIDNALKYAEADQPLAVEVEAAPELEAAKGRARPPRLAMLRVADRGAGIAPEHLPHLTRRFYRTDPGRSRAAGGTGLGLAIVKHIVERHRGKLDITSKLGVGTTVTIRLPMVEP